MLPKTLDWETNSLLIRQFYTNDLSQMAYYVESKGSLAEACVIDPMRDVDHFVKLAGQRKTKIKYIFLTHLHEDFVAGHIDLQRLVNAPIVLGIGANCQYKTQYAIDNESFNLGSLHIKAISTPGHTLESLSFILYESEQSTNPYCIFSGDTLLAGEVGRPDLVTSKTISKFDMAGKIFDSLRFFYMRQMDDLILFPCHGQGSYSGKNITVTKTFTTIGEERLTNYALQKMQKSEFIKLLTNDLPRPLKYMSFITDVNRLGYEEFIMKKEKQLLEISEFMKLIQKGTQVLDMRDYLQFIKGFIPGSISVNIKVNFAPFVGNLITPDKSLLLVCNAGDEEEILTRLYRMGYDNILGFLKGGFDTWVKSGYQTDSVNAVSAEDALIFIRQGFYILDVRSSNEFKKKRIPNSRNISIVELDENLKQKQGKLQIPLNQDILVICKNTLRTIIAISILKKSGINNAVSVIGGLDRLEELGATTENDSNVEMLGGLDKLTVKIETQGEIIGTQRNIVGSFSENVQHALMLEKQLQQIGRPEPLKPGSQAPFFEQQAFYQDDFKTIRSSDYLHEQYILLLFYPSDFTSQSISEIIELKSIRKQFSGINCTVLCCSSNTKYVHKMWCDFPRIKNGIGAIPFPLLADMDNKIARLFGVEQYYNQAIGCYFIINKFGVIKATQCSDISVARNFDEVVRLIQAFQFVDEHGEVCPVKWKPGEKGIVPKVSSPSLKLYLQDQYQKSNEIAAATTTDNQQQ